MGRPLHVLWLWIVLFQAAQVRGSRLVHPPAPSAADGRSVTGALNSVSPRIDSSLTAAAESGLPAAGGRSLGVASLTQGQNNPTRIINGLDAERGEMPWIAALVNRGQGFVFCSATVINREWLLTAAHCVRIMQPFELDVLVGKHLRNDDPSEVRYNVIEIRVHSNYVPYSFQNDVALLKVGQDLTPPAQVIALPSPSTQCNVTDPASCLVGETATIAGWGLLQGDTFELPRVLQKAEIPIRDNRNCARSYAKFDPPFAIFDSMLCAAWEFDRIDTCQGDSGGPLVVRDGDGGTFTLQGVVSVGYGCGRLGYFGIYQRVAAFTSWIKENIAA